MIERILHITTESKWESVQGDGILKALSDPWIDLYKHDNSPQDVVSHEKYLVGIPPEKTKAWRRSGIMRELKKYLRDGGLDLEERGEVLVTLDVPVLERDGFVREYKSRTPKHMNSVSPGLYLAVHNAIMTRGLNDVTREQLLIYKELIKESLFSAVNLEDYDGSFKVPEVWLPQDTPVDLIREVTD